VLGPPFEAAAEHEIPLQDLDARARYDVAWATHALYALPPAELTGGVARMVTALRPGGFGAVAHASAASHYVAFHDAYHFPLDSPDVLPRGSPCSPLPGRWGRWPSPGAPTPGNW